LKLLSFESIICPEKEENLMGLTESQPKTHTDRERERDRGCDEDQEVFGFSDGQWLL